MNNHRHLPDAITCTPPPAIVRRLFGWLLVLAAFFLWMLSPVPAHAQSADLPFAPDVNAAVMAVAVQADGKVLIGGDFTQVNGVARTYLARLHADGTLDTSFAPTLNQSPVLAIAALSDGKIMIGGDFTTVNGVARSRLAQLNADGSLATAFAPPSSHPSGNYAVHDIVPTPDGKFLVGRYTGIGRFNSDGSVDFFTATNAPVWSVLGLPDGRILAGGQ